MARTLNPATHAVRRDAILDVAERLIRTSGYDRMSVQEIQDELGVSRGAIYHYFGSKGDILEAVIERMTDTVLAFIEPIVRDPDLPPVTKLQRVFAVASQWKAERKDLMLGVARAWYSDHNALVRDRLKRLVIRRLTPLIADVLQEGKADGDFDVGSPERAAEILMALLTDAGNATMDLMVARQAGAIPFEQVESAVRAYNEAFERILGVRSGSLEIIDMTALRFWFA